MPDSAIASGCVDFILTPEQIADQIMKIIGPTLSN
jgi:chemotaxis response regulator CheB